MTQPMWMLLGFAAWTVILLLTTVGVYRWGRILTGRARLRDFREYSIDGAEWYRRAMRAHANCIENLPVFGAIVLALYASGVGGPTVDWIASVILAARVMQSLTHVCLEQTSAVVLMRFSFFLIQLVSFLVLIALIVQRAGTAA